DMSGHVKVLSCGDVQGKFVQLVKRVKAINEKSGPFEMLLCVGEFFGPNEDENERVTSGAIEFPIPTYILGPCCPSTSSMYPEESEEFSSNVTYLGRRGLLNTASGLQIAYLSGVDGSRPNQFTFGWDDVQELLVPIRASSGFLGVDILLTSMWPAEVAKHAHNQPPREVEGAPLLSRLASALKPRYHFAGMGTHYERDPYRNHRVLLEPAQHVTRFIGLAGVGNEEKEKWIYAFSIQPMKKLIRSELTVQPPNSSEFPYMDLITDMLKREAAEAAAKQPKKNNGEFFFDMSEPVEDTVDRGGRKRRGDRDQFFPPTEKRPQQPCWFCLSNNDAEKHLVVAVGDYCYSAMPKGPLVEDHAMILTIGHIQSMAAATEEVRAEVDKFKNAFTLMAHKAGKAVVVFERNYRTQHLQVQCVPVPKACIKGLKSAFQSQAQIAGTELALLSQEENVWDQVNEGCPYFYVELPDGTKLFTRQMKGFPLQFAREVLASDEILGCEDKVDWRACELGKEEETKFTKKLQERFKPFDFTDAGDSD
ncbi:hypothetical protein PENTCL1PPCAC_1464, partial [Pristionchus entomophagus]